MQMLPNEIRFRDPIAIAECLLYRDSEDIKSMMKMNNIHLEDITGVLDDLANGTNSFGKHPVCCHANAVGDICRCSNCLNNPGELCPALMAAAGHSYNAENSWSDNNSNANMNDFVNKLIQSQDDIPRELAGLSLNCGLLSHSVVSSKVGNQNNINFSISPENVTTPELPVSEQSVLLPNVKSTDNNVPQYTFHHEQAPQSSLYTDGNIYLLESSPSNHGNVDDSSHTSELIHKGMSSEEANLCKQDHSQNMQPMSLNQSSDKKEISGTSISVSTSSSGSEFSFHSNGSNRGSPQTPTLNSKAFNKIQVTRSSSVLPRCNSFDHPTIEGSSQWLQTRPVDDLVLNHIQRLQPTITASPLSNTSATNNTVSSLSESSQANWQFRPIKPQVDSGMSKINNTMQFSDSVTNKTLNSSSSPSTSIKHYSSSNTGPPLVAPIPLHLITSTGSSVNSSQNQAYVRGPTPQIASCWTVLQPNSQSGHGDISSLSDQSQQGGIAFTHHPAQSAFKTGRQSGLQPTSATPTRELHANSFSSNVKQTVIPITSGSQVSNQSSSTTTMIPISAHNTVQPPKYTKHIVQAPQSGYLIIPAGYLASHQNGSSPILLAAPQTTSNTTSKPQIAQTMKVNLVNAPAGSMQIQRMPAPTYPLTAKTTSVPSNSTTSTLQTSGLTSGTKLSNSDDTSSDLILISSNATSVDNPHQLQLVTQSCVSPLTSNTCSSVPSTQQHSILSLAQPQQFRINSKRSQAAIELHSKFESLVEQHRLLENDRKKTEAELIRQNPGKKISHMSNNNLTKNSKDNTRVDKELNSILTNHSRVVNLISKMEKLRNDPLPSNIHSAMDCWLEGIRKCQARRKEEMVNSTNRARCGGPRHQDDKDMLALSQSLSELCQHTRRARTSLWAALQMTDKEQATSLQQALNHLAQLASYSIRPQANNITTSVSTSVSKHGGGTSTAIQISSSSSINSVVKLSSAPHQSITTDSLATSQAPPTSQGTYGRAISVQPSSSPTASVMHQSQQQNAVRIPGIHQSVNSAKIVFSTAPAPTVGGGGHTLAYQPHPGPGIYSMYYTCTPSSAGPQASGPITYTTPHIAHHPSHPHQLM